MKKTYRIMFLLVGFLLIFLCPLTPVPYAIGEVPHLINYQGRLADISGAPLNGSYSVTFRIYDAETAGSMLWEETHTGLVIQKGIFSVLLGSVTNLGLAFDKQYYLEIKVGTEVMSPRQKITSAGYAVKAEKADTATQANNADTVGNVGVSTTPVANKILPLDSNAKLPLTALKVYDSGWFAVSSNSTYTKTHNLGTTKAISMVYFSQNSDGSGIVAGGFMHYVANYNSGSCMIGLTTTTIGLRVGTWIVNQLDASGNGYYWTSGYARIIILALE